MKFTDLQLLILAAGGDNSHYKLLKFLLQDTFKSNQKDFRIGHSLISLFPPKYHSWLSLLFWQEEYQIAQSLPSTEIIRVFNSWEILTLHSQVNQIPYGNYLQPYLFQNQPPKEVLKLQSLTNLNYSGNFLEREDYQIKLNKLLKDSNLLEFTIKILGENNKVQAAYTISNWLGFSQANSRSIGNFFEKWQYQNL